MKRIQLNNNESLLNIAEAMYGREVEYSSHELNKNTYENILSVLPKDDWPEHLVKYKNLSTDEIRFKISQTTDTDAEIAAEYQWRDQLSILLVGTILEMKKVDQIYHALEAQIPVDQKDKIIQDAIVRRSTLAHMDA